MADTPTIVVAHLDDEKLKSSIQSLVTNINTQMDLIKAKTTNTVAEMQKSLQTLGNIKVSSVGSDDGGASRRKKAQEEETQAIKQTIATRKELKMTLDQQASAMQPKSARDSYYAFFQGYKAQAQQLGQQIQQFETALNQAVTKRVGEIEKQINTTKSRIQELNNEMNRSYATNNMSVAAQKQRELQTEVRKLTELQRQLNNVGNEFATSKIALASMYAEHHRISNIMKEEVATQRQQRQETQQQVQASQQATSATQANAHAERDAAQAAREHADRIKDVAERARNAMSVYGSSAWLYDGRTSAYVYAENDARAKGLTIEQQIANILQQEIASYQNSSQAVNQILETETKITQEYDKRKRYKTPYTGIDESFNRMVANKIGLTTADIRSTGTSISSTTTYLKQLEQAYKELSRTERNSPFGKQLREQIQLTSREIQRFQAEMSRPINLASALNLPAHTIEDITYKMRQLASYRSGLDVDKQRSEINDVNKEYAKLQKKMDEVLQKNQQLIGSNNALGRSWNYMKNRLAFYFTVGASTAFIKNLIEIRSQYEMNERALGILINSAERGTQIFNELSQMALVSPYTLIELSTAAKQLTAYDVAARDVVDTTRRLADMASAVGIPIERLTYALGQIKAYGYLNSRDARMFSNAGIPLVKQLSEYYTELEGKLVSTADIYDRIKKKAIGYNDVMQVVYKMTDEGGKFFDFQAKMADTLKVRLANFTLAWNNMLNDIGASNQGVIVGGINLLTRLLRHWRDLESLMYAIVIAYGAVKAGQILYVAWSQKVGITTAATDVVSRKFVGSMYAMKGAFTSLVSSPMTWWMLLATAVASAGMAIYEANEKLKAFNKSVRDGAQENYKNVTDFVHQYEDLRDSLYKYDKEGSGRKIVGTNDIDKTEANKVWETMREQIELTSASSDEYIKRLLTIGNISERVREGFNVLDNIQSVNAALKEMSDDTMQLNQKGSGWWNLWTLPDGLIQNLKDYNTAVENAEKSTDTFLNKAVKTYVNYWLSMQPTLKTLYKELFPEQFGDTEKAFKRLQDDLKDTTDSINEFINVSGWEGAPEKIAETYSQVTQKIINESGLDPQQAFTLQLGVEEAKSKAMMQALQIRINDENAALAAARDENSKKDIQSRIDSLNEQLNIFSTTTAASRVYWNDFTKYMKEQHISEVRQMFKGMDDEQIKSLNFQEDEQAKFVQRMVEGYAKKHKMSYDDAFNYLKRWVLDANQWSIFIKLNIGTEDDKSIYDILSEADSAADTAYKKMERLRRRQKELEEKGTSRTFEEYQESAKITEQLTDLQKEYNDALEKGGHSQKEEKKDAKDAAKSRRDAAKAQRDAETELQKALKDELQLIDKVRSQYEKLSKAGVDNTTALNMVTNQFESSISHINSILGKNGLPLFDISKFAGTDNPNAILAMLKSQLDAAKGAKNIKSSEIKDLEVKFSEITVDAKVYNTKKISEGLNNELGKLKEEYELAVEMDATPELSNVFADMMGISDEQLKDLPKDFEGVVKRLQSIIDTQLGVGKFNLMENLNKTALNNWLTQNQQRASQDDAMSKVLTAYVDYANKIRRDETKKQTDEWNKLLEKYAEYEYKVTQIQKEAEREREAARKKGASQDILDAINNREQQQLAQVSFEEFQKSPEWIVATGELANMSRDAISTLISKLELYKKTARNLTPKQIKEINRALKSLYKEQRQGNPFGYIANMLDRAKDKSEDFDEEISKVEQEIRKTEEAIKAAVTVGNDTSELENHLDKLKKRWKDLKETQEGVGKLDANAWVGAINETINAVKSAIGVFDDLAKAISGVNGNSDVDKVFSILEKAGEGAAIGAQIGGGYGAIIGAVAGGLTGLITTFGDKWSGNESLTKGVQESERAVKRLELAYVDLEHAISDAYGVATIGAQKAAIANKELQLAELKRQLNLENSRKEKNRDENRILELQKQIKELEYDIKDSTAAIVNDLMGISSVGDALENVMKNIIDAFRGGSYKLKDIMKDVRVSFNDMIAEMVMKMYTTKVLQPWFEEQWNAIQEDINSRAGDVPDKLAKIQNVVSNAKMVDMDSDSSISTALRLLGFTDGQILALKYFDEYGNFDRGRGSTERLRHAYEEALKEAEKEEEEIQKNLATSMMPTQEDIMKYAEMLRSGQPIVEENLKEIESFLRELGLINDKKSTSLSALQQGIQGITEETAGALEAYMNSVSQQVYLHSDLLTQIRDAVVGFDLDVQTATVSQILLQLQSSYQVQMSIQSTLNGWSNPNGMAVRVEMVS